MAEPEEKYHGPLRWLLMGAVALAVVVVILGAYTRLVHAGLGCPDWPGCYGFLVVPEAAHEVNEAQVRFPDAPVETQKAWAEMIHRYFAGTLGIFILLMAVLVAVQDSAATSHGKSRQRLHFGLLILVIAQAAFGMWTVTLKLWPQVVTAHLLGGFATLGLLWFALIGRWTQPAPKISGLRSHAALALVILICQIALGGWTSSNYAALACPDLPTCQGEWWPNGDFQQGFNVWQEIGPNYLGGLMESAARIAIHVTHRLGALAVLLVVGVLGYRLLKESAQRNLAVSLLLLLLLQLCLGVANVYFKLPLAVATAHNAVAALLLLSLITVNYRVFQLPEPDRSRLDYSSSSSESNG